MLGTAPKRPYKPIIVYAGESVKEYLAWGMLAVAALMLVCPVCGARLIGNGWRKRVAKERSKGGEASLPILVHQLVCPHCRDAGRRPWHFRVLPSFLSLFQHFVQHVRLAVFHRAWEARDRLLAIEAATGADRWLVRAWLAEGQDVLAAALGDCGGEWPAVEAVEAGAGLGSSGGRWAWPCGWAWAGWTRSWGAPRARSWSG